MAGNYVGFYWTLPVPRVGFTHLPEDAAEAAALSRTIRYQRESVRHFVHCEAFGHLVAEFAWLERAPDRGSANVEAVLNKAFAACKVHAATLVYVEFIQRYGWRSHHHLRWRLEKAEVPIRGLDPEPLPGEDFDPIRHFEDWRRRLQKFRDARPGKAALRETVLGLIAPYLPPEALTPDYASAAEFLNEEGVGTTTGRPWTRDNLRMFLKAAASALAVPLGPAAES